MEVALFAPPCRFGFYHTWNRIRSVALFCCSTYSTPYHLSTQAALSPPYLISPPPPKKVQVLSPLCTSEDNRYSSVFIYPSWKSLCKKGQQLPSSAAGAAPTDNKASSGLFWKVEIGTTNELALLSWTRPDNKSCLGWSRCPWGDLLAVEGRWTRGRDGFLIRSGRWLFFKWE